MGHARKGRGDVAGAGVNGKPGVAEVSKGGRVTGNAGVAEAMARRRREIERGDEAALAALHAAFRRVVEDELSRGLYASELRGLRGDGPSLHVARYAAPTLRRGEGYAAYFCRADRSEAGSRRRRGCDVEISWR